MISPKINQQITFLGTTNLANTAEFYERVLGLELVVDQGTCRIYRTAGSAYLGFCQRETAPEGCDQVVLTLVTDEVDECAQYLLSQGIQLDHPPKINHKYNIYHFYLSDPNGYKIEIQKFLHPFG